MKHLHALLYASVFSAMCLLTMFSVFANALEVSAEYTQELPSSDSLEPPSIDEYPYEPIDPSVLKLRGTTRSDASDSNLQLLSKKWTEPLPVVFLNSSNFSENLEKLEKLQKYQRARATKDYSERIAKMIQRQLERKADALTEPPNQLKVHVTISGFGTMGKATPGRDYIDVLKYRVLSGEQEIFNGLYRQSYSSKSWMAVFLTNPRNEAQIARIVSKEILAKLQRSTKHKK